MQIGAVPVFENIDQKQFKEEFYEPQKPVVMKGLSKEWPAYTKWNWDYIKRLVGDQKVALYNNIKSDAYTPINAADDYKTFGGYSCLISSITLPN
jgi:hypothetical protein